MTYNPFSLSGKELVLITGAAFGIGRATAIDICCRMGSF